MNKKANNVMINSPSYGRCFDQWRAACPAHWQALCDRFRTATELEVDFWQMGLSG